MFSITLMVALRKGFAICQDLFRSRVTVMESGSDPGDARGPRVGRKERVLVWALTVLGALLPGGGLAQAQRAVERLVAQGQRGHGAAAAAGRGSRRLSERSRASAHRARP